MKLCQKCADECKELAEGSLNSDPEIVKAESECEFWAHKELNKSRYSTIKIDPDLWIEASTERLKQVTIEETVYTGTDLTPDEQATKLKRERERSYPK